MLRFVLAILNLLGFPGIGTFLAGHRRIGIIQACLAFFSLALTLTAAILLLPFIKFLGNPEALRYYMMTDGDFQLILAIGVAVPGVFIFLCNWLWSAATTKLVNKTPPPLPNQSRQ